MKIKWIDNGREAKCVPNPKYPLGIDLDVSDRAEKTCKANLPYPAKRCGYFLIECKKCGQKAGVTTAGRPDDPRSIKMACRRFVH